MNNFQFTFYDKERRYKPITVTIVPRPQEKFSSLKTRAVKRACAERHWSYDEMIYKYGYKNFRYRQVDKHGNPINKTE